MPKRNSGSGSSKKGSGSSIPLNLPPAGPAVYKRIACIRYVRPVAPYDSWGFPMLPGQTAYSYGCPYPPYGSGYYGGEFPSSRRVLILAPQTGKPQYKSKRRGSDDSSESREPHVCDDLIRMRPFNGTTSFFKVRDPCCQPTRCCKPPVILPYYDPCCIANRLNLRLKMDVSKAYPNCAGTQTGRNSYSTGS